MRRCKIKEQNVKLKEETLNIMSFRFCVPLIFLCNICFSQKESTVKEIEVDTTKTSVYKINDSVFYTYNRFKPLAFVKNAVLDFYEFPRIVAKKEYILPAAVVAASTALLLAFDDDLIKASKQFGNYIDVPGTNNAKNISKINGIDFYVPTDLSSSLYYIGDGITEVMVNAGFYAYGLMTNDSRALTTASELSEGLITVGITVQVLKHATGRQSPSKATEPGGDWEFFPSWKEYNSSVPAHDAFPSGHLMTAMMTTTVISANYPEYPFIKPVCFSLITLCGFQMMNNGVHWASDYPLAIALGYTLGQIAVNRGRRVIISNTKRNAYTSARLFPFFSNQTIGLALRMDL